MAEEADEKEPTEQRSYRLPLEDIKIIEGLAAKGLFGSNKTAVVRELIKMAIRELVNSNYLQKKEDFLDWLKKK
jgi:hypothetical protein